MQVDLGRVDSFLERHQGKAVLLFGFTSIIWEHLYGPLVAAGRKLALGDATLIDGGGWKKLGARGVERETFQARIAEVCGVSRIFNYYGMVEQAGSIFMDCRRATCTFDLPDVVVRDHQASLRFQPASPGWCSSFHCCHRATRATRFCPRTLARLWRGTAAPAAAKAAGS